MRKKIGIDLNTLESKPYYPYIKRVIANVLSLDIKANIEIEIENIVSFPTRTMARKGEKQINNTIT